MIIPSKITPELAEETGWHIGDGSMNYYKNSGKIKGIYQLRGHIEDDKSHYLERIKPIFNKIYGLNINLREMPSTRVFGFQIWSNELIKFKESIGLPLGKKFNISIPKIFLDNKELEKSVIRGIFDTDGGIYLEKKNNKLYPRIYITTISSILSEQLKNLMQNLGLRTTVYSQLFNKNYNRQTAYSVTIRGEVMFHRFMEEINPKNPKHIEKYHLFLNSKTF
ncbi:MAG: LAGLIDADG family homing endonuclease [Nanoarchaeota archaeon]